MKVHWRINATAEIEKERVLDDSATFLSNSERSNTENVSPNSGCCVALSPLVELTLQTADNDLFEEFF